MRMINSTGLCRDEAQSVILRVTTSCKHSLLSFTARCGIACESRGASGRQKKSAPRSNLCEIQSITLAEDTVETGKYTAENVVLETPLPQENVPPLTPQSPLDDERVKLLEVPLKVYVASVCVDQVPADKRPPTVEPDDIA